MNTKKFLTGITLVLGGVFMLVYSIIETQWVGVTGRILLAIGWLEFYFFVVLLDKHGRDNKKSNRAKRAVIIGVLNGLLIAFYTIGISIIIINSLYNTAIPNWAGFVLNFISIILGLIISSVLNRKGPAGKTGDGLREPF